MKSTTVFFLSLVICSAALARGPSTSGGGVGVVCRDARGTIQSAELLDLYEAKNASGLTLISQKTMVANYQEVMTRWLSLHGAKSLPESDAQIQKYLDDVLLGSWVEYSAPGEVLPSINDYYFRALPPEGCELEQLAVFKDEAVHLKIQSDIWKALDAQNKTALLIHEMIYRSQRLANGSDRSDSTRAIVGFIFSTAFTLP